MREDFLVAQLAACSPLEFVRFWSAADGTETYDLVVEVVREEGDGVFSLTVGNGYAPASPEGSPAADGNDPATRTLSGADSVVVAAAIRDVLDAALPAGRRVSLTHGSKEELVRRRRIDGVVDAANAILAAAAPPGAWTSTRRVPVQFRAGEIQLSLWPKQTEAGALLLEVWALVALSLPETPEVADLISRCNEGFTHGRLLRQTDRLWYRDTLHADPLSNGALLLAVEVAIQTATGFGPKFAELGAVDGSAPVPEESSLERPPDGAVNPMGYL